MLARDCATFGAVVGSTRLSAAPSDSFGSSALIDLKRVRWPKGWLYPWLLSFGSVLHVPYFDFPGAQRRATRSSGTTRTYSQATDGDRPAAAGTSPLTRDGRTFLGGLLRIDPRCAQDSQFGLQLYGGCRRALGLN